VGSIQYRCRLESSAPVVLVCFRGDLPETLERPLLTFSPSVLRMSPDSRVFEFRCPWIVLPIQAILSYTSTPPKRLTPTLAASNTEIRRPYLSDSKHLA